MRRYEVLSRLIFIFLSFMAISTMVNAPGIGYGYGLVVLVMIIASWLYNPLEAFAYLFISHTIATFISLETRSAFLIIFLLSNLLRPLLASMGSYLKERHGRMSSSMIIVALDSLIALTIAIAYYGDDGIHAAFSVYEFVWIPFAYIIYRSLTGEDRALGLIATLLLSLTYIISIFTFMSLPPLISSITGLLILTFASRGIFMQKILYVTVIVLVIAGLALGGLPLKLNFKVMSYTFTSKSWSDKRWSINTEVCGSLDNVFEGVHNPSRLRIVKDCIVLTGKVTSLPIRFDDGDYCFDLKVMNTTYPISLGGYILRRGSVHVEIIPKNQAELLSRLGGGLCPGDIVKVVGVYVIDTDHGLWSEVHPALKVEIINRTTSWPQCIWSYVEERAREYSSSK